MSFAQAMVSLQLMAEEKIGAALRLRHAQEQHEQDASWDKVREQLRN